MPLGVHSLASGGYLQKTCHLAPLNPEVNAIQAINISQDKHSKSSQATAKAAQNSKADFQHCRYFGILRTESCTTLWTSYLQLDEYKTLLLLIQTKQQRVTNLPV